MVVFATIKEHAENPTNLTTISAHASALGHTSVQTAQRSTAQHLHQMEHFRGMECTASRSAMAMVPATMVRAAATAMMVTEASIVQ